MRNLIFIFLFCISAQSQIPSFPGAAGGGAHSIGGRGKVLCIVNTLDRNQSLTYHAASGGNDEYYTGGLFPALQNADVGYIVFNVSGNIQLGVGGTAYSLTGVSYKTIFGQSAPQGGITLTGGTFRLEGVSGGNQHLIIRYIRSRPVYDRYGNQPNSGGTVTDDGYTWALSLYGGNNIIVDHFSGSFTFAKVMGGFIDELHVDNGATHYGVTYQHNIMSDGHTGGYAIVNPDRRDDPQDFMSDHSWLKNLFLGVNRTPNLGYHGYGEVVNNVIYETPSKNMTTYFDLDLNHLANYYIDSSMEPNRIFDYDEGDVSIFTRNNYHQGLLTGNETTNNTSIWNFNDGTPPAPSNYFTNTRHTGTRGIPYTEMTAQEAYQKVVVEGDVGAYKYLDNNGYVQTYRDSYDSQMLDIAENGTSYTFGQVSNYVLPSIPNNTRPANYDTDNDGMADAWEIREFGNLNQSYRGDFDGDGYENIEEYMNQVDGVQSSPSPTCSDGIQNGDETGIDCGGSCSPCAAPPTGDQTKKKKSSTVIWW